MSRAAKAVKKEAVDGLPPSEIWRLAHYGERAAAPDMNRAAQLADVLRDALWLEQDYDKLEAEGESWPGVNNRQQHENICGIYHQKAWCQLRDIFSEANRTGDGSVFASLAVILQKDKSPNDLIRAAVGQVLQLLAQFKLPMLPIEGFRQALRMLDINASYNSLKNALAYYGVKPAAGKKGRPKKPRK